MNGEVLKTDRDYESAALKPYKFNDDNPWNSGFEIQWLP